VRLLVPALAVLVALAAGGCGAGPDRSDPVPPPSPAPALAGSVTVHGDAARLDGAAADSDFIGAAVLDRGLMTPCQAELTPVRDGRYSFRVLAAAASTGCGAPGSRVVLWIAAHDRYVYSSDTVAWPTGADRDVAFDPTFDSSKPDGASPAAAQFNGAVYDAHGELAPVGTEVEAFVGDVRCGVASVRRAGTFQGYVLAVVGPDAIPGCTAGAPIRFLVDGKPAHHDPVANRPPGVRDAVDLREA
jgi:hypothetical protein